MKWCRGSERSARRSSSRTLPHHAPSPPTCQHVSRPKNTPMLKVYTSPRLTVSSLSRQRRYRHGHLGFANTSNQTPQTQRGDARHASLPLFFVTFTAFHDPSVRPTPAFMPFIISPACFARAIVRCSPSATVSTQAFHSSCPVTTSSFITV